MGGDQEAKGSDQDTKEARVGERRGLKDLDPDYKKVQLGQVGQMQWWPGGGCPKGTM